MADKSHLDRDKINMEEFVDPGVFNTTIIIILLRLAGYIMIITNPMLQAR